MNLEKNIIITSKLEKIETLIKFKNIYDANKKYKKLLNDEKYEEIFSSWERKSNIVTLENIEKLREYLKNMPSIPTSDSDFTPSAPNFSLVNVLFLVFLVLPYLMSLSLSLAFLKK